MSELDGKIVGVFGDAAVEKSLARLEVVSRLPRFIAEYLVSKYYRKGGDWVRSRNASGPGVLPGP
jgi:ATP-dependent Lon protease